MTSATTTNARRVEPRAALCPVGAQARMGSWVPACATDISKRFAIERERIAQEARQCSTTTTTTTTEATTSTPRAA